MRYAIYFVNKCRQNLACHLHDQSEFYNDITAKNIFVNNFQFTLNKSYNLI